SGDLATDRSAVVDLTEVIVGLYLRKQLRKQGLPLGRRDHDPPRLGGQRHRFIRIDPGSIEHLARHAHGATVSPLRNACFHKASDGYPLYLHRRKSATRQKGDYSSGLSNRARFSATLISGLRSCQASRLSISLSRK